MICIKTCGSWKRERKKQSEVSGYMAGGQEKACQEYLYERIFIHPSIHWIIMGLRISGSLSPSL